MQHSKYIAITVLILSALSTYSQENKWIAGVKIGAALVGFEESTNHTLQFGPMGEYAVSSNIYVGSEFTINIQNETATGWFNYLKYYFDPEEGSSRTFFDAGIAIWFAKGGPFFGAHFGGGANFSVSTNLSIPAEFQIGPIFGTKESVLFIAFTTGIRYSF
ncbi:MAG: hypothetical protein JW995_09490 [Melioribacteraceae bacterium]|nr:hypothetical protein [Melioribacteraceae bacterium]